MDRQPKYRKHIRLKGFDYSSGHYYFVTLCTKDREELFAPFVDPKYGHKVPGGVAAGLVPAKHSEEEAAIKVAATEVVKQELDNIPERFENKASVDFYCLMPNHLHMIVALNKGDHKGRSYTLGNIIGSFKSLVTRDLWKLGLRGRVFQINYYEHIIRSEDALDKIRTYILHNPWIEYDDINWKRIDPS